MEHSTAPDNRNETPEPRTTAVDQAQKQQIAEYEKAAKVIDLMTDLNIQPEAVLLTLADLCSNTGLNALAAAYSAAAATCKEGTVLQRYRNHNRID